jgi:transcriptional regulator with XRE-family HTH domain
MPRIITSKEIGEQIKKARQARKISQEKLGELVGVTFQQIQKYENGSSKLSPERLQQVAHALGLSATDFLKDSKGMPKISPLPTVPKDEERVLALFRKMAPEDRALAVDLLKATASAARKRRC